MSTTLLPLFLSLLPTSAGATPPPAPPELALQDPKPDKREDVKEQIATLEAHLKKRGDEDQEAVGVIGQLHQVFPDCGPKDRASIAKALGKVLGTKRKPDDEGNYDNSMFRPAAVALGDMGPESVKVLIAAIDGKTQRENLPLVRELILALGRTRDLDGTKTLGDMLKSKDAILQGAAAEAIGQFHEVELDVRKDLFEEMLKQLMAVKGRVDSDGNDTEASNRYEVIRGPILTSLQALSGQSISDPDEWQRWWNKNKKEDWDAEA